MIDKNNYNNTYMSISLMYKHIFIIILVDRQTNYELQYSTIVRARF